MARVSGSRILDAPPSRVRSAIRDDLEGFVGAGGFDEVTRRDEEFELSRSLGLATLELTVRLDRDTDTVLAFDAVDGIFERMHTEYEVEAVDSGSRVVARTDFTLGGLVGNALDETLVSTQRKREFEDQFEYLERRLG